MQTLAGKANADLLDWDSTTWRTNNTELMNMTSDQYVLIFTKAKNKQKYAFLRFTSGSVNHSLEVSSTCFLNFDQE